MPLNFVCVTSTLGSVVIKSLQVPTVPSSRKKAVKSKGALDGLSLSFRGGPVEAKGEEEWA